MKLLTQPSDTFRTNLIYFRFLILERIIGYLIQKDMSDGGMQSGKKQRNEAMKK